MRRIISLGLFIIPLLLMNNLVLAEEIKKEEKLTVLSSISIFKPLIADTKWPRFTVAYHYYSNGFFGHHIFSPNFGAVLPMIRGEDKAGTTYEFSIHA